MKWKTAVRLLGGTLLSGLLVVPAFALQIGLHVAAPVPQKKPIPPFTHVFYIMMENHGTSDLLGNPNAPFINQLVQRYGYENNYFGVTHVSLPNYVAAISGNNWYSNSDDPTQSFPHTNLVDQLTAHHISWKGYMQSLPSAGWQGYWYPDNLPAGSSPAQTPPNALYAKKHDPFLLFPNIAQNPQLAQNVVPLRQLAANLDSGNVPRFSWISPNVCSDMHGQPSGPGATCPFSNDSALVQAGDNFLKQWIPAIMRSKAWTGNSVIFVTWDEAGYPSNPTPQALSTFTAPGPDAPVVPAGTVDGFSWQGGPYGGGQVPLIVISRQGSHPVTVSTWANHYSLLRTIEQSWNLGYLGMAGDRAQVHALSGFFVTPPQNPGKETQQGSSR